VTASPLTSGWFYAKREQTGQAQVGPLSWEQLAGLAQTGALVPYDLVWHETLPGWVPAAHVSGLFPGGQWPGYAVPPEPAPVWNAQPVAAAAAGRRRSHLPWIIPLAALVLVGAAVGLVFGLRGGDDDRGSTVSTSSTILSTAGSTLPGTASTVVSGESGTWLVMMYEDADDEILEEDMTFDLNEAELAGSSDQVKIVAQMDRYVGGYDGGGDATSTKRYLLTQDADLYNVNSEELADLGEVDMGDGQSLYDFATWAIGSYPAEHYVLILSDHGGGWTGGWTDDDPEYGSGLSMQEIDDALGAIVADTGIGSFELVGFDACLMGQLEVMSAVAPHARYAVASEESEPSLGWGYAEFLRALRQDPSMTGRELGQAIVDSYVVDDVRITDDEARSVLAGGDFSADTVAAEVSRSTTLSTIDLGAVQDLNAAVNGLVIALMGVDQELVAQARAYSQSYDGVFGEEDPPSYIDLGHFVDLVLEGVEDQGVTQAAEQVRSTLEQAVTAEAHGEDRPGSSGLAIYFPNSVEYVGTFGEWTINYPSSIGRFATASLWDDYLTYHYTGALFEAGNADVAVLTPAQSTETDFSEAVEESAPEEDAEITAPGAGQLSIAPISVSASEIGLDDIVTLNTEITGQNIAYVYYYVSYYWEDDGSYLTADAGFVEPGATKEIGGVYYPDWGEEGVASVEYEWDPTLYYMSDGNEANDQFAFFEPTVYGADVSEDIYTVRGTYTFMDTGTLIDAEIDFNGNGDMQSVWGYSEENDGSGTWHEITPKPGDTFTITDEYLEFDMNPDGEFVDYDGGVMTFGETPFTMVAYYVFPGDYTLAIGVEDLDGNITWEFTEIVVTE
jgi:hypothetical protein